jgi:hypothetical protein
MTNQNMENAPVLKEQALVNMAAQTALDLDSLFQQHGLHVFKLDLGDKHHCLITSVDSFVADVKPLLMESKAKLRTSLAIALQELAAEQLNHLAGSDYCLDEPSVTLLDVPVLLELVKDEGITWTCPDEAGRTAIRSALEAKRMHLVAPGQSFSSIAIDPHSVGTEEFLRHIFRLLSESGTLAVGMSFYFDAQGRLVSATDAFEETHRFGTGEVPPPVCFRAEAMLDVVNLKICSELGTQLCDETLAMASEFGDTESLAVKLFDLYFGEGVFEQLDEPIELPVTRWIPVDAP